MESSSELIKQGAEGRIYKTTFLGKPAIHKVRFSKKYRHPDLDAKLTKSRLRAELKGIIRCKALGIRTPTVYFVDTKESGIYMERIEDVDTVDACITGLMSKNCEVGGGDANDNSAGTAKLRTLAREIGLNLGKMHASNIIHGDLTTSNILVGKNLSFEKAEITMIDFGLSSIEQFPEQKGVDLYVLERALLSTHSSLPWLFELILKSYAENNKKDGSAVLKKLDEIRLRGRKRTMVG